MIMVNKKIIIAGGTGFIGQGLVRYFGRDNQVLVLTRQIKEATNNRNRFDSLSQKDLKQVHFLKWDGKTTGDWAKELEGADLVINLAGKSVNCRYTEFNKKEILESRVDSVKAIGAAILNCKVPPKLWINASSATIYRHAMDRPQDEYTGELGSGFSVDVCKEWERSFYEQECPSTRRVALRMAITLGSGGVLIPYFNLLKFGLGGKQGPGGQRYSWIHITDSFRIIEWIDSHNEMQGTYNCSSPNPVTNKEFMLALRRLTGNRMGLPVSSRMLKIGAWLIGTDAELVLKSRWVLPSRLLESGFHFKYPLLADAFEEILARVPRKQYRLP